LLEGRPWWFQVRRLVRDLLAAWDGRSNREFWIGVGRATTFSKFYPADAWLEGVEPDEVLAKVAAARSPIPHSEHPSIGFHRKFGMHRMTA